jgi:hypothetical protein
MYIPSCLCYPLASHVTRGRYSCIPGCPAECPGPCPLWLEQPRGDWPVAGGQGDGMELRTEVCLRVRGPVCMCRGGGVWRDLGSIRGFSTWTVTTEECLPGGSHHWVVTVSLPSFWKSTLKNLAHLFYGCILFYKTSMSQKSQSTQKMIEKKMQTSTVLPWKQPARGFWSLCIYAWGRLVHFYSTGAILHILLRNVSLC